MFPVQITLTNVAQLNAVMAALAIVPATPEAPAAKPVKPKAEPKVEAPAAPAAAPAVAEAAPAAPAAPAQEPQVEAQAAPAAYDYTTTAGFITKVAGAKGKAAALEILAKFGTKSLKDVAPENFAAIVAECEASLK